MIVAAHQSSDETLKTACDPLFRTRINPRVHVAVRRLWQGAVTAIGFDYSSRGISLGFEMIRSVKLNNREHYSSQLLEEWEVGGG